MKDTSENKKLFTGYQQQLAVIPAYLTWVKLLFGSENDLQLGASHL
jgi:hypothetical protein